MKRLSWLTMSILGLLYNPTFSAPQKRVEVPIELNVGIGPAFHYLPLDLSNGHTLLPGLAIELYAVIPPQVLRDHRDRIPHKYRRMINLEKEMFLRPLWLSLVPTRLLIQPGTDFEAWGATWSLFTVSWDQPLYNKLDLQAAIMLPTFSALWIQSPRIEEGDVHLYGFGVSPSVRLLWKPLQRLQVVLGWDHHLYLPLVTNEYTPLDRNSESLVQHGTATLIFHWRIPSSAKI